MKKIILLSVILFPLSLFAQQKEVNYTSQLKTDSYTYSSNDNLCVLSFDNGELFWRINASCGFTLPFNIVHDKVYILWNPKLDCTFDPNLMEDILWHPAPKQDDTFAIVYRENSQTLRVAYQFPYWIKAYNEKYQTIFETSLSLVQPNSIANKKPESTTESTTITNNTPPPATITPKYNYTNNNQQNDDYGTLVLVCNSHSDYEYFINGVSKGVIKSHNTERLQLTPGYYDVVLLQKNGYLMKPTSIEFKVYLGYHKIFNYTFPY